jgi:hypothetical protein
VWIVEDGEVHRWDGDFGDYKDELVKEIAAELDEQVRRGVGGVGEGLRQVALGRCWGLCWLAGELRQPGTRAEPQDHSSLHKSDGGSNRKLASMEVS